MKKKQRGLNMVERALIAQKWRQQAVDAKIHALIGDNSKAMVQSAGRMLYVALGAAMQEQLTADDPDIRVIRGAVNAVHDQVDEAVIADERRASILSGLHAVGRIVARVSAAAITNAACDLELKLRCKHIHYSDFQALLATHP